MWIATYVVARLIIGWQAGRTWPGSATASPKVTRCNTGPVLNELLLVSGQCVGARWQTTLSL
jgi:hypothetical protein